MFGLAQREQRWKAEQEAAELGLKFLSDMAMAKAREAEAINQTKEIEVLKLEVAKMREQYVSNAQLMLAQSEQIRQLITEVTSTGNLCKRLIAVTGRSGDILRTDHG